MLRESNFSSPLAAGRISNESSSRNRLHSTPIRSTQYPKCTHSVAVLARQLREMSPFSSPIKKNEVLDSGLGEPQEASLLSRSSSRCSKVTNACHSIHQQSAYSELYTGSVSSHLNLPSTPSLESTTWSLGVDSSSFSSCLGEPTYIYDCSLRTTYHKGKYLGKGGFARVHELEDVATGNIYAGKIIPKSRITKPRHMEKINREIELHKNLVHENIVKFHHCFEDESNVYIILENCARRSLAHLIRQRKTLTESEARNFLSQLGEGLRYLHQQNIVHRDLKLGNMLLTKDAIVKICDFGLASHFEPDSKVSVCGTPNYIAPEVLERQAHGFEADIWAVGCIMYAMLVGQPPFETISLEDTYARIAENLYELPRWLSRSARSLICQLLAPDPCQRPTLDEMLSHEFFTCGVPPSPMACNANANESNGNDSGFRSDFDSTNENATAVVNPASDFNRLRRTAISGPYELGTSVNALLTIHKKPEHSSKENRTPRAYLENEVHKPQPCQLKEVNSDDSGAKARIPICDMRNRLVSTTTETSTLYSALNICLENSPRAAANPQTVPFQPIYVSKWIDYSNRHGFGFQLSDGYVGILFNDCSRIGYSERRSCVDFQDEAGIANSFAVHALPDYLTDKLALLSHFVQYMEENMIDGGGSRPTTSSLASPPSFPHPESKRLTSTHMKRWVRTPEAIIMQLNDKTLQINFLTDHTKIVLSSSVDLKRVTQFWVTYINSERSSSTYKMTDIATLGCNGILRERLVYALTALREFEELDAEKKM